MGFLNKELLDLGCKVHAVWKRWSHYSVQLLVPDDINILEQVNLALVSYIPGAEEMLMADDHIEWVEHFTDRNFIGNQPKPGFQVIKVQCWFFSRATTESMWDA